MTDESGFLTHLRANPTDAVARLAFADWLDEQGDPLSLTKASYLRHDATVAEVPDDNPAHDKAILQMRELAKGLPTHWKMAVSRVPVEGCGVKWEFVCPKKWEQLTPTDDDAVRFCTACKKQVHYCDTIPKAQLKAWSGHCVAIDLKVPRSPDDLETPRIRATPGAIF